MDGYPPYPPAYSPTAPVSSPPQQYGFQVDPQPFGGGYQPNQNYPGYPPQPYPSQGSFDLPPPYSAPNVQAPVIPPQYCPQQPGVYDQSQAYNPPQQPGLYPQLSPARPPPPIPPLPQGYYAEGGKPQPPLRTAPPIPPSRIPSTQGYGFEQPTPDNTDYCRSSAVPLAFNAGYATPESASHGRFSASAPGPWQDTPLPSWLREVWQCGHCPGVYFLQEDGMIVCPQREKLFLKTFLNDGFDFSHCRSRRGSTASLSNRNSPQHSNRGSPVQSSPNLEYGFRGDLPAAPSSSPQQQYSLMVECPGIFRVKLSPSKGHVFLTAAKDYLAMVDQGTYPSRTVIIALPKELDQTHLQKLITLLEEYASVTTETGGVVTTVTSTVESAFNYTSKLSSGFIKDSTPELHKTTRGFRKGMGTVARLGGTLVSKGINLVAETVAPTPKEEKIREFDSRVNQLKSAVATLREKLSTKSITYVMAPRGL